MDQHFLGLEWMELEIAWKYFQQHDGCLLVPEKPLLQVSHLKVTQSIPSSEYNLNNFSQSLALFRRAIKRMV